MDSDSVTKSIRYWYTRFWRNISIVDTLFRKFYTIVVKIVNFQKLQERAIKGICRYSKNYDDFFNILKNYKNINKIVKSLTGEILVWDKFATFSKKISLEGYFLKSVCRYGINVFHESKTLFSSKKVWKVWFFCPKRTLFVQKKSFLRQKLGLRK